VLPFSFGRARSPCSPSLSLVGSGQRHDIAVFALHRHFLSANGVRPLLVQPVTKFGKNTRFKSHSQVGSGLTPCSATRIAACDLNGSHMRDIFKASTLKRPDRPGNCDGLKLDEKGNIWATGPGGVLILSPEGKHLGTIITGAPAANLAWGVDGHTLFFSTSDGLRRIQTKVKGAGF
jgi:hypothetical protein